MQSYHNIILTNDKNPDQILEIESALDSMVPSFLYTNNLSAQKNPKLSKSAKLFGGNKYLFYLVDDKIYVDIHHIISNLTNDSLTNQKIFRDFSEEISFPIWCPKQNKLVRRELIDYSTMTKMILSHQCDFSDTFRLECVCSMYIIYIFMELMIYCMILLRISRETY